MAVFYLDNDVTVKVVPLLETLDHTVHTTVRLDRRRAGDHEQLLLAAQNGWVLITHNWEDFRLLQGAWHLWSRAWGVSPEHAGVLVIQQGSPQQIAEAVIGLLHKRSAQELVNSLFRHRATSGWVRHL